MIQTNSPPKELESERYVLNISTSIFFRVHTPNFGNGVYSFTPVTIYYLPGTSGWGATFAGYLALQWSP